jgi:hypothetical protein
MPREMVLTCRATWKREKVYIRKDLKKGDCAGHQGLTTVILLTWYSETGKIEV